MGKIPGGDRAFVDPAKVAGYILTSSHRVGQHKARVFAAALNLGVEDVGELIDALKLAAITDEAEIEDADQYGVRYAIQFTMERQGRSAVIRSSWIIRSGEDFPRLATAFVAKQES